MGGRNLVLLHLNLLIIQFRNFRLHFFLKQVKKVGHLDRASLSRSGAVPHSRPQNERVSGFVVRCLLFHPSDVKRELFAEERLTMSVTVNFWSVWYVNRECRFQLNRVDVHSLGLRNKVRKELGHEWWEGSTFSTVCTVCTVCTV